MQKLLSLIMVFILLISICACARSREVAESEYLSDRSASKTQESSLLSADEEKEVEATFRDGHINLPGAFISYDFNGEEYFFLSSASAGELNYISCLNKNFKHKWTVQTPLSHLDVLGNMAVGEKAVYCIAQRSVKDNIYEITAHSIKDGALLWEKSFETESVNIDINAVKDRALIFISGIMQDFCGLKLEKNFSNRVFSIDIDGNVAVTDLNNDALSYSADCEITDHKNFLVFPDNKNGGFYTLIDNNSQTLITRFNDKNEPIDSVTVNGQYVYRNQFDNTILVFSEDRIYFEAERNGAVNRYNVTYCFSSDLELLYTVEDGGFMNPLENGESAYFEIPLPGTGDNYIHICDENGSIIQSYNLGIWEMDYLCRTKDGYEAACRYPSRFYELDENMNLLSLQRDEYSYFFVAYDGKLIKVN